MTPDTLSALDARKDFACPELVTLKRAGRSSLVLWGADNLPHPEGDQISAMASHMGLEAALTDWRREHRHALRWRSSFSMGGGIGIARVPHELAPELAVLVGAFLEIASHFPLKREEI